MPALFGGCESPGRGQAAEVMDHASFKDIPGITEDEIKAIEALQKQNTSFVYGSALSTEGFYDEDGEVRGFSAFFAVG